MASVGDALRAEGGLLAAALGPDTLSDPIADALPGGRGFAAGAVREGWRLHGGAAPAPVLVTEADPDLGLLAGDRLYALGLERLAADGDVEAIGVLAGAIALCARAAAEGDPERARAAWASAASSLASTH